MKLGKRLAIVGIAALLVCGAVCSVNAEEPLNSVVVSSEDGETELNYLYEYDENGNRTSEICQSRPKGSEDEWTPISRILYVYDEAQKKIRRTEYSWNDMLGGWSAHTKTEWEYDEAGRATVKTVFAWDEENGEWMPTSKSTFEYEGDSLFASREIIRAWDTETCNWSTDYTEKTVDIDPEIDSPLIDPVIDFPLDEPDEPEEPEDPEDPDEPVPVTGDTQSALWTMLALCGAALAATTAHKVKAARHAK